MQLTYRQASVYIGAVVALAAALVSVLLESQGVGLELELPLIGIIVGEVVWYAIWCSLWNRGGAQAWVVDFLTMVVARGGLSLVMALLIVGTGKGDFQVAFMKAYFRYGPGVIVQILAVPLMLYFWVFLARLHPAAESLASPGAGQAPVVPAPSGTVPALRFNPHDPRASTYEGILSMFVARDRSIGAAVISDEGLPLANVMPPGAAAETVGAYAWEMLPPLRDLSEKMGFGAIHQATLHTASGTITLVPAQHVLLLAFTREQAHAGFAPQEAQQLADTIQRIWVARYGRA